LRLSVRIAPCQAARGTWINRYRHHCIPSFLFGCLVV